LPLENFENIVSWVSALAHNPTYAALDFSTTSRLGYGYLLLSLWGKPTLLNTLHFSKSSNVILFINGVLPCLDPRDTFLSAPKTGLRATHEVPAGPAAVLK
jgi:hypothetical protein